jgi:hypothetical protein
LVWACIAAIVATIAVGFGWAGPDKLGVQGCATALAGWISGDLVRHAPATGVHSMTNSFKRADPKPATETNEQNRFENIRKAAAERRRKADTDGTRRRARQTVEDNRLI